MFAGWQGRAGPGGCSGSHKKSFGVAGPALARLALPAAQLGDVGCADCETLW